MDVGALQTVRLIAVERPESQPHFRQSFTVGGQGVGQLTAHPAIARRGRQFFSQGFHLRAQVSEGVVVLHLENPHRDPWRHRRIPITIAPNPRAEPDWCGAGRHVASQALEADGDFLSERGQHVGGQLIEVEHR